MDETPNSNQQVRSDPLIGQTLMGNYRIVAPLGEGGMAVVYRAIQLKTDRMVAIKTLKTRDPHILERFNREMKAYGKLDHKNIVEAFDCFEWEGQAFLVMECVEGKSLFEILPRGNVQNPEYIATIMIQICDALAHAHENYIIHRDLKPANVMLANDGNQLIVKILDFGVAKLQDDFQKLTSEGQAIGSPLYMSPEQCKGEELTPRADLYTLGILSYELITGRLPYQFSKLVQVMAAHCDPSTFPQDISEIRPDLPNVKALNSIIMRAVETDQDRRFQSADEFKQAVEFWINTVRKGVAIPLPFHLLHSDPIDYTMIPEFQGEREKPVIDLEEAKRLRETARQELLKQTLMPLPPPSAVTATQSTTIRKKSSVDSELKKQALRNFLIGLTVSGLVMGGVLYAYTHWDSVVLSLSPLGERFNNACLSLSGALSKSAAPEPAPQIVEPTTPVQPEIPVERPDNHGDLSLEQPPQVQDSIIQDEVPQDSQLIDPTPAGRHTGRSSSGRKRRLQ